MASTDYDVVVNGTKAKLKRGVEGAYRKRYVRREIQQQLLTQSENPALASRDDLARMMQTNWSGGSAWWKPILGPSNIDSYFQSNHMDLWTEPGKVLPMNKVDDAANTDLHDNCVMAVGDAGDVYAIGSTSNVNGSFYDVYKWTPGSDAFVQETGYHSGITTSNFPVAMCYDPNDKYFYILRTDDVTGNGIISRFKPSTSAQDSNWVTVAVRVGANIFIQNGQLMFYNGQVVRSIDKSAPSSTTEADDGLGVDLLNNISFAGTNPLMRASSPKLAVSSPSGIYYVKTVHSTDQPQPWVFRVEKDDAGAWIVHPVATLPLGSIALSIHQHMGSILVTASPDASTILDNDTNEAEVVLYHITGGQPGVIASILGGRDQLDETPFSILGTNGPLAYIGGHKRLWVYDASRGGLHSAFEWGTELSNGPYVDMAFVQDSDGDGAIIFIGRDRIARTKTGRTDDPDTVTSFGDDETHYALESNYFDFNLPFETKELSKVEILHDPLDTGDETDANQEWTVQISADDGGFSDVLVNSDSESTYGSATLSGTSGRRFRYKLIYQTKDTERIPLRGLLVSASGGQNVREYELILDGEELLNVDNEVQNPEAFYDALTTIAGTETQITFVDNFQEQDQETDTGTTSKMKVRAVEFNKDTPGESTIQVVLRDA